MPDEATDALVAGIDVIVHLVKRACDGQEPGATGHASSLDFVTVVHLLMTVVHLLVHLLIGTDVDSTAWLDACTRDTYNLLRAAVEAGSTKVVLCSTLECFAPYVKQWGNRCLDTSGAWPSWKPLPSCAPAVLGPHMAEYVVTEFAHAGALRATIVRHGDFEGGKFFEMVVLPPFRMIMSHVLQEKAHLRRTFLKLSLLSAKRCPSNYQSARHRRSRGLIRGKVVGSGLLFQLATVVLQNPIVQKTQKK